MTLLSPNASSKLRGSNYPRQQQVPCRSLGKKEGAKTINLSYVMVLKIYVKRKPGGELCNSSIPDKISGETIVEELHESSEIRKSEIKDGFRFVMNGNDGETWDALCVTAIMGFEIQNEKGLIIDSFASTIDEKEIAEYYK